MSSPEAQRLPEKLEEKDQLLADLEKGPILLTFETKEEIGKLAKAFMVRRNLRGANHLKPLQITQDFSKKTLRIIIEAEKGKSLGGLGPAQAHRVDVTLGEKEDAPGVPTCTLHDVGGSGFLPLKPFAQMTLAALDLRATLDNEFGLLLGREVSGNYFVGLDNRPGLQVLLQKKPTERS